MKENENENENENEHEHEHEHENENENDPPKTTRARSRLAGGRYSASRCRPSSRWRGCSTRFGMAWHIRVGSLERLAATARTLLDETDVYSDAGAAAASSSAAAPTYDLHACVVHEGDGERGHYFA